MIGDPLHLLRLLLKLRARQLADVRWRLLAVSFPVVAFACLMNWNLAKGTSEIAVRPFYTLHFFGSIFTAWISLAVLGNFFLGWYFPLDLLLRLPMKPYKVFLTKTLVGLTGLWLIVVLPCFLLEAWRSARWEGLLFGLALAIGFAMQANAISALGILLLRRNHQPKLRIPIMAACALLFSVVTIGSIRTVMAQDNSLQRWATQISQSIHLSWTQYLLPARWTAKTFGALRTGDYAAALHFLLLHLSFTLCILIVELFSSARIYFDRPAQQTRPFSFMANGFGFRWALGLSAPLRTAALLYLREAKQFASIPSALPLSILFLFYCPTLILLIPQSSIITVEALFIMPFFFFLGIKANLLGPEYHSANLLVSQPLGIFQIIVAKNRLIDTIVVAVITLSVILGEAARSLTLDPLGFIFGGIYLFTALNIWDMLSALCSIRFPEGTDQGQGNSIGLYVGQALLFCGPPITLGVFSVLEMVAYKAPAYNALSMSLCGFIALFVAAYRQLLFTPWIKMESSRQREHIYLTLTKKASV